MECFCEPKIPEGCFMLRFTASLLTKKSKIHLQDTSYYWAKRVWDNLVHEFQQLSISYKIKNVPLAQWIKSYGLQRLLTSLDPSVRKALNEVRQYLQDYVAPTDKGGKFQMNEVNAFKTEYGTNVTDWLYRLSSQTKLASLLEKADDGRSVEFEDVGVSLEDENQIPIHFNLSGTAYRDDQDELVVDLSEESLQKLEIHQFTPDQVMDQVKETLDPEVPHSSLFE